MTEIFKQISNEVLESKTASALQSKPTADAVKCWNKCLNLIKDNVSSQVYKTWFLPIKALELENNKLTLSVPSQFFFEWIEEHYYELMRKTISQILNEQAKLEYRIIFDDVDENIETKSVKMPGFRYNPNPSQNTIPFEPVILSQKEFPTFLNPKYSLENFIQGESNQLASSAAIAISQNPGKTKFNPLVIYGDTGLGKTHLAQGIGNYISKNFPRLRVLYTDSERFTLEFVNSIQNNKTSEFSKFYRSIDVLIVDDIQFFAGKERTQDNFFHTFNSLYQAGKQIILTSDKPPKDLVDITERLKTRFQMGLMADVQPPDYETRIAILRKKALNENLDVPFDVLEFIANQPFKNIRELEGTLIRLLAYASLNNKEITIELAKEVLRDIVNITNKTITLDEIKNTVANYFNINKDELDTKKRSRDINTPRQIAIYLTRTLTDYSLPMIGKFFGGRDHSTIIHAYEKIKKEIEINETLKVAVEEITNRLMFN